MPAPKPQVVIIDDDAVQLAAVKAILERRAALEVVTFDDTAVEAALVHIRNFRPVLIILDQHISERVTGTELLSRIRTIDRHAAVMFVSADPDSTTRTRALNLSADAFLRKPYDPDELVAHVYAILRRYARHTDTRAAGEAFVDGADFMFAGAKVSPGAMTISFGGNARPITPNQLSLVTALRKRPHQVITRAELTHEVWGVGTSPKSRVLDQTIYDLRNALREVGLPEPFGIRSIRGVGYQEAEPVPPAV